eukprot:NODE_23812_length_650_cov_3.416826.p1 GENE.NODE_23812_length_650_cov_3.416826~~NODE_23812_length_650_cov_3.416826.p1  ORF type:complete len:102 (+),score=0.93 NODE_23812_length_650_cov_3.416826:80-385(+)
MARETSTPIEKRNGVFILAVADASLCPLEEELTAVPNTGGQGGDYTIAAGGAVRGSPAGARNSTPPLQIMVPSVHRGSSAQGHTIDNSKTSALASRLTTDC